MEVYDMAMEWKALQLGPIGTNCYLIKDTATGKGAVIDPGDEPQRVLDAVRDSGMELAAVFLTHAHYDHTGAVPALKEAYPGLPIYLHDADFALGTGNPSAIMPQAKGRTASYGDGDVMKVGELELEVIHTPGHTPGGVTLKCGDVLFTGDTLFQESMGRTDFPGGSDQDILASLKKLARLPGDYQVCPGHEAFSTLEHERQYNYYMKAALRT